MFTLKLYKMQYAPNDLAKAQPAPAIPQVVTRILEVEQIQLNEIGYTGSIQELWVLDKNGAWLNSFYVGYPEPHMDAVIDEARWEWAYLENSQGKTTHHINPVSTPIPVTNALRQ